MLKYNEHRPEQRSAEANATATWLDRCRRRQEKQARRRIEAARFDRRHRMVMGNVGPEDDVEYHDSLPGV